MAGGMPRNKLGHTSHVHCIQNRFPNQTHLSVLSDSKSSHQKPSLFSVQTRSDFTDLHVRGPLAHWLLIRRSTPIRQSNRENIFYVMLVVRQHVSKSLSPWNGLSHEKWTASFQTPDSDWNSRIEFNDNYVRTKYILLTCSRIRSRKYSRQYWTRDSTQFFTHF